MATNESGQKVNCNQCGVLVLQNNLARHQAKHCKFQKTSPTKPPQTSGTAFTPVDNSRHQEQYFYQNMTTQVATNNSNTTGVTVSVPGPSSSSSTGVSKSRNTNTSQKRVPPSSQPRKCANCGGTFSSSFNLRRHQLRHCTGTPRSNSSNVQPTVTKGFNKKKERKCNNCEMTFSTEFNLQRHQQMSCPRKQNSSGGQSNNMVMQATVPDPVIVFREQVQGPQFISLQQYHLMKPELPH